MTPLLHVLRLVVAAAPWILARGILLALTVVVMGAALLGLSGWFVTAAGLAGLAGIGIGFDFFRPSAGVRMLALGRTAGRYGERLLTHDATLKALSALRVDLLRRTVMRDGRTLANLRSESALTRIVQDVDALDGLILRLFAPALAALGALLLAFLALWWLVGGTVAAAVLVVYLPLGTAVLWRLARRSSGLSGEAEERLQELRRGLIDAIRDREALIVGGNLPEAEGGLIEADTRARAAARKLDRQARLASLGLSLTIFAAAALALVAGGFLAERGELGAAAAAIGFFVALALGEALLPLRRGVSEIGRMQGAARRIAGDRSEGPEHSETAAETAAPVDAAAPEGAAAPVLRLDLPSLKLELRPGEGAALIGPSGAGKTTLLMSIAALSDAPCTGIEILGQPPERWLEARLRETVAMVPQRSVLIAGTIRDNFALAAPIDEDSMWAALTAVEMDRMIHARGGLSARLGEGGSGLSGGESRRLCLARAIVKRPALLILDEPTEGLDDATADTILKGLRAFLPHAAILAAMHRGWDHPAFQQRIELNW